MCIREVSVLERSCIKTGEVNHCDKKLRTNFLREIMR